MGFGGGGSAPPVAPAYSDPITGKTFGSTAELNSEVDQRTQDAQAASDAATAKTASDAAAAETAYQARAASARSGAETNVRQYFKDQGLDPDKYWASNIAPALDRSQQSIQDLDPNPSSAYAPTLGASLVNDLTSGKRNQFTDQLNSLFPSTYANSAIPDTADDASIASIISQQFDPLNAQLTNAQKRGTLNDTGYQAALDKFNTDQTSARSTLSSLGSNVINTDRSGLNDYIGGAKNDAANVSLKNSDSFDPNTYTTGAQSKTKTYLDNMQGDIQNQVGNTKFSDLTTLLNAGGSVQGAYDPTATNPAGGGTPSPSYIADQVLGNTKRGLGSAGAF